MSVMTVPVPAEGSNTQPVALNRRNLAAPAAPVRLVHLGLGAFHRAHQAWYTAHSSDAAEWGIAAFTGRTPTAAEELADQDGLYTLIVRAEDGDNAVIVPSISAAIDGSDMTTFLGYLADPRTAAVTLTVTEPGYHLRTDGEMNYDDPAVAADVALLTDSVTAGKHARRGPSQEAPTTAMARLLLGLDQRRRTEAGPIAIVPCDNIPANGALVDRALTGFARAVDPSLAQWICDNVSFVSTSIDRITPKTTDADRDTAVALTGYRDRSPVVTEPFTDWILCGEFPAGRPDWESAGARFVTDIEPFERRKLWLLNGAHSLLAYLGLARGHATVADAIADIQCRSAVDAFWEEAARDMPAMLEADDYRAALIERFSNPRIAHNLAQIGMEGATKLAVRITPVAQQERAAGRDAPGCVTPLAAWIHLAIANRLPTDARAAEIAQAATATNPVVALISLLDRDLAGDNAFVDRVRQRVSEVASDRE